MWSRRMECNSLTTWYDRVPREVWICGIGPYLTIPDRKSLCITAQFFKRMCAQLKTCHANPAEIVGLVDWCEMLKTIPFRQCVWSCNVAVPRPMLRKLFRQFCHTDPHRIDYETFVEAGLHLGDVMDVIQTSIPCIWVGLFDAAMARHPITGTTDLALLNPDQWRWTDPLFYGSKACDVWIARIARNFLSNPDIIDHLHCFEKYLLDPALPKVRDVTWKTIQHLERKTRSGALKKHFEWTANELTRLLRMGDA